MAAGDFHIPDWRDASAYAPLLGVDRSLFAWEWLRRDPAYRDAAIRSLSWAVGAKLARVPDEQAGRWGLLAFEPPWLPAGMARPLWRRDVYPNILCADACDEAGQDERLDLGRLEPLVTLRRGAGGTEHLLLSDGRRMLRVDILSGTVTAGPVLLRYRLSGIKGVGGPLLALRQLLALCRDGRFSRSLHPPEVRAARWILVLRTHDALVAGACQREIAERLLDPDAALARWRVVTPTLRARVQRLARQAGRMAAGGYLSLLAHD